MQKFINKLQSSLKEGSFVKLTLSKPSAISRQQSADLNNVYVKPIILKNEKMFSFTYRYERRDETKNYDAEQTLEIINQLVPNVFLNASLFTLTEDITLLISKKGKATVMSKAVKEQREQNVQHDKVKNRLINTDNPWWFKLGLTTREGKVTADMQHKFKQICKYVEIVDGVMKNVKFDGKIRIADMGAGKGYLTFALYEYLTQRCKYDIEMEGVEIRPDLVVKINEIIKESINDLLLKKSTGLLTEESTLYKFNQNEQNLEIKSFDMNNDEDKSYIKKHINEIWDLLQKGYEKIGGFKSFQTPKDLLKKTPFLRLGYCNENIVAIAVYNDYVNVTADETPTVIASTANPYKFSASVLAAITDEIKADNEFDMVDELFNKSNEPVPQQLATLKGKEPRFTRVSKKEDMKQVVFDMLGI